jgi:hypothetical protein
VTFGIEPLGHALASPPNRLRIRCSGLGGELRALVKLGRLFLTLFLINANEKVFSHGLFVGRFFIQGKWYNV